MNRVLFVTSEIYPLIKTGGLADVAGALPRALAEQGISIKIFVPGYSEVLQKMEESGELKPLCNIEIASIPGRTQILEGKLPTGRLALDGTKKQNKKKSSENYTKGSPEGLDSSHPRTPDRGAGSAVGLDARRCDAGIAALFQGAATQQTGSPRPNPPTGGVSGWELDILIMKNRSLFERDGGPYNDSYGKDWHDNAIRFGSFSRVAAHLASPESPLSWAPDIVHLNDWQSGPAAAYLSFLPGATAKKVFTIHNIAYAGIFDPYWTAPLDLPPESFSIDGVEFFGNLSFLKAGVYYSDEITTVSPTHAKEIQTLKGGHGLYGLLSSRAENITGILNGADYDTWNPEKDPLIKTNYSSKNLDLKSKNKEELRRELNLPPKSKNPLFGIVSRLNTDKGMDLILDALPALLDMGEVVVLGSGDKGLESAFLDNAEKHPHRLSVSIGYNEALAHRIIAGSDFFLMPSRMEPCGLTQMYAMRYGTLPIVMKVGGLSDSVDDIVEIENMGEQRDTSESEIGTGFVFSDPTRTALLDAATRALNLYRNPSALQFIRKRAMSKDFSWSVSAARYVDIYRSLVTH